MNRYLLPSSTYRILLCSLFCLACLIAPSAIAAQDPPPPAAAAQGVHIIILIDTSNSMLEAVGAKGEPKKGQESRIDAIKAPLSEMIGAIEIDQTNAKNNTTLHIYEFSKGAGDKGRTKTVLTFSGRKKVNLCRQLDITINERKDREEAKKWVEELKLSAKWKGGKIQGVLRPTWLYTSIDQVLTDAEKLQEADPNKPISFMVISDGADSENGKFKNMAQVLEKHGKTFNNLQDKYFIELVGFNNEGKKDWIERDGKVQQPSEIKELAAVVRKLAAKKVFIKFPELDFDILPGEEIWAINKEGIEVKFDNHTTCEYGGKKVDPADFKCEWKMEQFSRDEWREYEDSNKYNPAAELYEEGKYKITLTVSHPKIKEDFFKTKELTVKQFKRPKIAGDLGAQKPIAGKEVVIKFDKYPDGIAGIKGSTFIINHGDGQTTKGNENTEKVGIIYKEAKAFQTTIILSLPGGESVEIPGPAIAVKNPTGKIFVNKNDPWIGEKVTFKSLYPIDDDVKAVYTWDLGDGMVKEGKNVVGHYQTSGKKNVKLTIEIAGLKAKVVAMLPPGEELVVKGINVQIGVGP